MEINPYVALQLRPPSCAHIPACESGRGLPLDRA
jgi:hypothetical protein